MAVAPYTRRLRDKTSAVSGCSTMTSATSPAFAASCSVTCSVRIAALSDVTRWQRTGVFVTPSLIQEIHGADIDFLSPHFSCAARFTRQCDRDAPGQAGNEAPPQQRVVVACRENQPLSHSFIPG
jgi:hypothetical protein